MQIAPEKADFDLIISNANNGRLQRAANMLNTLTMTELHELFMHMQELNYTIDDVTQLTQELIDK